MIDSEVPARNYKSRPVSISPAAARLGNPQRAVLAAADKPLALLNCDGRLSFAVQPDPVATIIFK